MLISSKWFCQLAGTIALRADGASLATRWIQPGALSKDIIPTETEAARTQQAPGLRRQWRRAGPGC
jgi:hypothetical protein